MFQVLEGIPPLFHPQQMLVVPVDPTNIDSSIPTEIKEKFPKSVERFLETVKQLKSNQTNGNVITTATDLNRPQYIAYFPIFKLKDPEEYVRSIIQGLQALIAHFDELKIKSAGFFDIQVKEDKHIQFGIYVQQFVEPLQGLDSYFYK